MSDSQHTDTKISFCTPSVEDYSDVTIVKLDNSEPLVDYLQAMKIADKEAGKKWDDFMMLSWYDRDRDFESPQHASECHMNSAVPGYVDYALYHGAKLKIDIEDGRFVFFYLEI